MLKFLHVDDVHIGRERLDGALPSQDFADAFDQAVDAAIREKVDFVLVAGDFFDKARIEPHHLAEGEAGLRRLEQASIPVIAIEGNHDVVSSYDDRPSWLSYLNRVGLLRLLRTEFRDGKPVMKLWTEADRAGNWLDLGEARIYGAGWFGASTAKRLELLKPCIERRGFTILLLHAGVLGMAEEFGMIHRDQLAVVRDAFDYVALGHIHQRYVVDGWAHNGGSLENWDLAEDNYDKGYWIVEVRDGTFEARPGTVDRRPVHLAAISCDGLKSIDEIVAAADWTLTPRHAVRVKLTGMPTFEIDLSAVASAIRARTGCAAVEAVPAFGRRSSEIEEGPVLPREVIEAEEIEKLVAATGRYGEREKIVADLVRSVVQARSNEELYAELLQRAAPLLEHANPPNPTP